MRASDLVLLACLLTAGCVRPCKDGTLFVDVNLGAASGSDSVQVRVSDAGAAQLPTVFHRAPGGAHESIEVDFSRYPRGESITIDVLATGGGMTLGQGEATVVPSDACERVAVDVAAAPSGSDGYTQEVLVDAPLVYLRLGEATPSMPAKDDSGNGIDGVYQANDVLGTTGIPGTPFDTAATLTDDGTSIAVTDPRLDFVGTAPFSLEAWIAPTALDDVYHYVFNLTAQNADGKQSYGMVIDAKVGVFLERWISVNKVQDHLQALGAPPAVGSFTHVVGTYDGAQLAMYVNGALDATQADARSSLPKSMTLFIGAQTTNTRGFAGAVDEVAVYDHALAPDRVAAHYRQGIKQ